MTKTAPSPMTRSPSANVRTGRAAASASATTRSAASSTSTLRSGGTWIPTVTPGTTNRRSRARRTGCGDVEGTGQDGVAGTVGRGESSVVVDGVVPRRRGWTGDTLTTPAPSPASKRCDRGDEVRRGPSAATWAGRARRHGTGPAARQGLERVQHDVDGRGGRGRERGRARRTGSRHPRPGRPRRSPGRPCCRRSGADRPRRRMAARRAVRAARPTSGIPPTSRRFLPGTRWLPPRAGIRKRTPSVTPATPGGRRRSARSRIRAGSGHR